MTAESGSEAVANGREVTRYDQGYCQKYVRGPCWEVGSLYGSAIDAWNGARFQHPYDRNPPVGAPCYYEGGQYGHAVISVGGGRIRSTDCQSATYVNDAPLSWPETAWGYRYLGWTEDINGVTLPLSTKPPKDDDMPEYAHVQAGPIDVVDDQWHSIQWEDVISDPGNVVNAGDFGLKLGGRKYTATFALQTDVADGELIRTRLAEYVEHERVEAGPVLETFRTSGTTYLVDTRTGWVGDGRRLRAEFCLPRPARISHAALVALFW